jgi:hypothetical protein
MEAALLTWTTDSVVADIKTPARNDTHLSCFLRKNIRWILLNVIRVVAAATATKWISDYSMANRTTTKQLSDYSKADRHLQHHHQQAAARS